MEAVEAHDQRRVRRHLSIDSYSYFFLSKCKTEVMVKARIFTAILSTAPGNTGEESLGTEAAAEESARSSFRLRDRKL